MFRLAAIAAALTAGQSLAAGFGEISLQSRIGEPLRAEIPLVGDDSGIATACFRLAPLKNSDLPVLTAARIRLLRVGDGYRIIIAGSKAIQDPAFVIALRADCGVELERDYVLMPQPPVALPLAETAESVGQRPSHPQNPASNPGPGRSLSAFDGDTLESIAESLAPDDAARRRRLLAGLRRANPDLEIDQPLEAGARVRMPERPRRAAAPKAAASDNANPSGTAKPDTTATARAIAKPAERSPRGDRLVLGAPPEESAAREKPGTLKATLPEVEERILRMETTLNLLNQQVEKLNQAMNLATEALALQQQLQMAQSLQAPPQPPPATITLPPPPLPQRPESGHWIELLASALAGGVLVALAAHRLGRRPRSAAEPPPPQPPAQRDTTAETPATPGMPAGTAPLRRAETVRTTAPVSDEIDFILGDPSQPPLPAASAAPANTPGEDMIVDESESALQLAEIMLSFGRVRGAADSLASFIEHSAPDRIEPWLMLLNLYRRGDMQPEYETLMRRIGRRFNFQVPEWEQSQTPISGLKSLEDYGHVTRRLTLSWGTQASHDFLHGLIQDNRQGQRAGFPLEVVEEIALLLRVLEDGYHCSAGVAHSLLQAA